ncbi:unnamed protein product [Linum tenue]|uniref:Ribosomal protein S15 n=1 Tax=Linum tenue TaxID=586396 RepID=A0AAV0ITN4_9ROSI|nr:unnamed protein product [Linum tenue]
MEDLTKERAKKMNKRRVISSTPKHFLFIISTILRYEKRIHGIMGVKDI